MSRDGDGDHNPSTARMAFKTDENEMLDHLDKLLECPVCYDICMPPIITCCQGHSCCETCRNSVRKCPVCRGELSNVRNLFAEQVVEKLKFTCKNGCSLSLPVNEMAKHYDGICPLRPIHCRECDRMVAFKDFLMHVEQVDKLERQRASECSTGFEIDEDDLVTLDLSPISGRRYTVWEPTWLHCYNQDFFCFLDYNGESWWIWVSSLGQKGCEFKCQIILWSKELKSEHNYFGAIHPIHTDTKDVLESGKCLILTKNSLKNFMHQGGIDVLVRIERDYQIPKTRRGVDVQSPLALTSSSSSRTQRAFSRPVNVDRPVTAVSRTESRIPVSVTPPTSSASSRTLDSGDGNSARIRQLSTRRSLFPASPRTPSPGRTASHLRYRMLRGYRRNNQNRGFFPETQEEDMTIDVTENEE